MHGRGRAGRAGMAKEQAGRLNVKLLSWVSAISCLGPSIYDVRTEGGGGVRELADFVDEQY